MSDKAEKQEIPSLAPGEICPCKRVDCPRWGHCTSCYEHHHLPGKKLPTTCQRQRKKEKKA